MKQLGLHRAMWLSTALLVALGVLAFWPARRSSPPPRPPLRAPIVLDELVSHAPPSDNAASP
jgi:hypothetical protein